MYAAIVLSMGRSTPSGDLMPAPTRTTRADWIDAGLAALADGGPDAVRIDVLAQTLGVTRGGFYHQFDDRQALLEALLDSWEARSTGDVLERVEREGGDARTKVTKAGMPTFSAELLPVDLAVRDWARRDSAVGDRLRRVDNRRMDYLRSLISELHTDADDVEAIALMAFSLLIGNHFIAADHGTADRAAVLRRASERLLS
jgi:AcrR family transcriptional regulator